MMAGRTSAPAVPRAAAIITGLLLSLVLPGVFPVRAGAVFERDVAPSATDAVCGAGPAFELIDLLTRPEREVRWSLRATSMELYGLPELRGAGVSVSRDSPGASFSLGASSFGCRVYRERAVEVASMRRWSEDLVIGFHWRALCLAWEGGPPEWTGALDLSAAWLVHGRLVVGLSVRNLTRSSILSSPVSSRVSGDAALVLDGVTILASLSGEPGFAPSPALGCEIPIAACVSIRGGIGTEPSSTAFGLRLGSGRGPERTRWPDVDLAWSRHPVLGSSYSLTVSIRI